MPICAPEACTIPTDGHSHRMVEAAFEIAQVMHGAKKETDSDIVPFEVRSHQYRCDVAGVVGTRNSPTTSGAIP